MCTVKHPLQVLVLHELYIIVLQVKYYISQLFLASDTNVKVNHT